MVCRTSVLAAQIEYASFSEPVSALEYVSFSLAGTAFELESLCQPVNLYATLGYQAQQPQSGSAFDPAFVR